MLATAAARTPDPPFPVASIPELLQLRDFVPQNCSIGIYEFCVGYRYKQTLFCSYAPFDIYALLPDSIQTLPGSVADTLQEQLSYISPLVEDLRKLSNAVLVYLIVGTTCMMLALAVTSCLAFDNRTSRKAGWEARVFVHLVMAMCCAPYLTLVLKQSSVADNLKGLPCLVAVERGKAFGYSVGHLICAALFVALSAVMTCEKVVQCIKDRVCVSSGVFQSATHVDR